MEERILVALGIVALGVVLYAAFKFAHRRSVGENRNLPKGWKRGRPGILYFGSDNCAPCGPQSRAVEEVGLSEGVNVVKIDVDEQPETAKAWNVLSLPTTFVLDEEGEIREVNHGAVSEKKLRKQLERVISTPKVKSQADNKPEGAVR